MRAIPKCVTFYLVECCQCKGKLRKFVTQSEEKPECPGCGLDSRDHKYLARLTYALAKVEKMNS